MESEPAGFVRRCVMALAAVMICSLLAACGGGGGDDGPAPGAPGFDFSPPTSTQLLAVTQAWSGRDLSARDVNVVHEDASSSLYTVRVYQHSVGGNVHYGAVIIPRSDAAARYPVVVEADGLDQSNPSIDVSRELRRLGVQAGKAIFVFPAFRGRALRLDGRSWQAGGDFCDAYDGAADDTIALMNVVQARESRADFTRVLVRGGSRGGNVALLMGERDPRVRLVAAGSAPVDFYRQEVAARYSQQYNCQFINGKTPEQSRLRMLASSPLHFPMLANVSKVYLDQGEADPVVPLWNAVEMNARLRAAGMTVDYVLYPNGVHDLTQYGSYRDRQLVIFNSLLAQ